jgi:hypothetical protein
MASIMETPETTTEFRAFLRDLDQDEDDGVTTRTDWLDFVLACRELHEVTTDREQTAHAQVGRDQHYNDKFCTGK